MIHHLRRKWKYNFHRTEGLNAAADRDMIWKNCTEGDTHMNYRAYITTAAGERLERSGALVPDREERETDLIRLYPAQRDQVWEGFGGAVTDSAAYVWSRMPPELRQTVLDAYFSGEGLGYTAVRVPIDSCDFSLEPYEAAPDGKHFDMERPFRYILPMLEAIRERAPVELMLSPWSPPARYKTNGQRQGGGKCAPEHWEDWAEYLCRYVEEFRRRGFRVARLSLQNEPKAVQTWDSCQWSAAEERAFLLRHLKPALLRHGLEDVALYVWDHNKERVLDRALALLEGEGRGAAGGVAFHWYSGDYFDELRRVHALFPEKKLILSEFCVEYSRYAGAPPSLVRDLIAHELIGDLENGTSAVFDWNLLLDGRGGPNYVGNFCQAPFQYDAETGELRRQGSYDALWHFSHFIPRGSVRILSSACSSDIEKTAFLRPDGSVILVLRNPGPRRELFVKCGDKLAPLTAEAGALLTVVIDTIL